MNPLFAHRNNPFQGCGCNCLIFVIAGLIALIGGTAYALSVIP